MIDGLETPGEIRRHELFSEMAERLARHMMDKHGIEEDRAIDIGNDLADFLTEHWKGQNVYINSDREFRLSKRDWEIFGRMRRGNANDLAAEYGISYVRVHQVYRRCLAEARRRVQPDLFGQNALETGLEQAVEAGQISTGDSEGMPCPNSSDASLSGNSDTDVGNRAEPAPPAAS
ncbi:Mor transcription activator family protein [Variovorax paradoxus]|uniref:Mor transcription activator family protein n=1 Tax=Variovorax paradoxus TaxID=34073 RepID=UPI001ABC9767